MSRRRVALASNDGGSAQQGNIGKANVAAITSVDTNVFIPCPPFMRFDTASPGRVHSLRLLPGPYRDIPIRAIEVISFVACGIAEHTAIVL
jgi:hypothetical protein